MANTKFTDINITTSVAGFLANKLTESGWEVFWQARDVSSGIATQGSVTIVPEFPREPGLLVLPPRARSSSEILVPAFSVQIMEEPFEENRAGLGEDLFQHRTAVVIDGYVADQAQHLAFATMFRNWFRQDTRIPIYDFESNPVTPQLVDDDVRVENRKTDRLELPDLPDPVRYYINMQVDLVFFD